MEFLLGTICVVLLGLIAYLGIVLLLMCAITMLTVLSLLIVYVFSSPDKRLENVFNFLATTIEKMEKDDKMRKTKKPIKFFDDEQ